MANQQSRNRPGPHPPRGPHCGALPENRLHSLSPAAGAGCCTLKIGFVERREEVVAIKHVFVGYEPCWRLRGFHEHEQRLLKEHGSVFLLKNFPFYSNPFWNMKANETTGIANKVDVILEGVETIGSAERSTNPEEMRYHFNNISDGQYKNILYTNFSKDRVDKELDHFLNHNFFERFGGGIGVTRMIKAMEANNLL